METMMYHWFVFLHVAATLGFMLTHGVSVSITFALRQERSPEQVRALLELSANSYKGMYLLLLLLASGIIAGFMGQWWDSGWIWASLLLLIAIIVAMAILGGAIYSRVRKAAGLPYSERGKPFPAEPPRSPEEVQTQLAMANPILLAVVGYGGILVILWLMMFKPF
jgi:hypothetical protein